MNKKKLKEFANMVDKMTDKEKIGFFREKAVRGLIYLFAKIYENE